MWQIVMGAKNFIVVVRATHKKVPYAESPLCCGLQYRLCHALRQEIISLALFDISGSDQPKSGLN